MTNNKAMASGGGWLARLRARSRRATLIFVLGSTLALMTSSCGVFGDDSGAIGGDPVDVSGRQTRELDGSVATVTSAITTNDSNKLTGIASSDDFQNTDVSTILTRYRGLPIVEVPSALYWDHPGEATLEFKVTCPTGMPVTFSLEFVRDHQTWRPIIGESTVAAESGWSKDDAAQPAGGPPIASWAAASDEPSAANAPWTATSTSVGSSRPTYAPC